MSLTTPATGSTGFSPEVWENRRDQGISPTFSSGFAASDDARAEFIRGAELMGYLEPGETIHSQQLQVADTLAKPHRNYAIEMPRRTSKTTSIFLVLLGRCAMRPGYYVTYTAQSGVAGMRQFGEWVDRLNVVNENPEASLPPWLRGGVRAKPKAIQRQVALFGEELWEPPPAAPGSEYPFRKMLLGNVRTGIYFTNGSILRHVPPIATQFRGIASDVSWIDEAQEVAIEDGPALLAGIRPLQDTRPGASIILSGTAGESRAGIFYELLERGRAGDPSVGILDYAAPASTPWDQIENQTTALQLLQTMHPGIDTLTTLEVMRAQWTDLPRPEWAREYLSLWPETYSRRAISAQLWEACRIDVRPPLPQRPAFGLAVKKGGAVAAIVAAWRDRDGTAHVESVEHQSGTMWIKEKVIYLTSKYAGSTVAYDEKSEGAATVTEVSRREFKERTVRQTWNDVSAASVQFLREVERGTLRVYAGDPLEQAVAAASRRESGDRWTWNPMEPSMDITCLDAATLALRHWDTALDRRTHARQKTTVLRPTA
jgi:hypothetical protein